MVRAETVTFLVENTATVIDDNLNQFRYDEEPLTNIMTCKVAGEAFGNELLAAEDISLKAIEGFLSWKKSSFSKTKIKT